PGWDSGRHHQPPGPRGWQSFHEVGSGVHVAQLGVDVVADDLVPLVAQPCGHVAAHLAEADHAEVHARLPLLVARWVVCGWPARVVQLEVRTGMIRYLQSAAVPSSAGLPVMMAGLVEVVNCRWATSDSIALSPSSRKVELKAIWMSSPSRVALSSSTAWASSPVPASSTRRSLVKDSRSGVLRSATSETRLTASMNSFFWTSATELKDSGRSFRYLGNSPSRSRVVVRRPPPSKPIMPSPPFSAVDRAMEIWAPPVSDLAVSARVLAGTRATA